MTTSFSNNDLSSLKLGKKTSYPSTYNNNLLQSVPRSLNRDNLDSKSLARMFGYDHWYGFEVFWQNGTQCKHTNIKVTIPANSESIVESKSFKIYLYSFRNSKFNDENHVLDTISKDVSFILNTKVTVEAIRVVEPLSWKLPGRLLEQESISIDSSFKNVDKSTLIMRDNSRVDEYELTTNLLKSNCLITAQPDWGSLYIRYTGKYIDNKGLLAYILSYRNHLGFHEHCVEQIFCDILDKTKAESLTVYAQYTRRGALAIAPYRSTSTKNLLDFPLLYRT